MNRLTEEELNAIAERLDRQTSFDQDAMMMQQLYDAYRELLKLNDKMDIAMRHDTYEKRDLLKENAQLKAENECLEKRANTFFACKTLERYKQALEEISSYDVRAKHGFIDEWEEAGAFKRCQDIAQQALKEG